MKKYIFRKNLYLTSSALQSVYETCTPKWVDDANGKEVLFEDDDYNGIIVINNKEVLRIHKNWCEAISEDKTNQLMTRLHKPAEGIYGAYTRVETTVGPALLIEKGKTRIMITRDELGPMITEMIQMARELGVTKNQNDK